MPDFSSTPAEWRAYLSEAVRIGRTEVAMNAARQVAQIIYSGTDTTPGQIESRARAELAAEIARQAIPAPAVNPDADAQRADASGLERPPAAHAVTEALIPPGAALHVAQGGTMPPIRRRARRNVAPVAVETVPAPPPAIGGATFDPQRKFGIELECYGVRAAAVAEALNTAGIGCNVESYNHARRRAWKIVSDVSIHGPNPFELVSPPLKGLAGLEEIRRVCAILKDLGAMVNKSCGFHVHHDAADLEAEHLRNVLTVWWKYEEVTAFFVPPSRRANHFCAPVTPKTGCPSGYGFDPRGSSDEVEAFRQFVSRARDKEDFAGHGGDGSRVQPTRYGAVNFCAIARHGTVEFRSHSGTTDADKIIAWLSLTQWILTMAKRGLACRVGARMTGEWAKESRFFFRAIHWVNLTDPIILAAKETLKMRFTEFKALALRSTEREARRAATAGGLAALARAMDANAPTYVDGSGRARTNPAVGQQQEEGS